MTDPRRKRRAGDLAPNPALWAALDDGALLTHVLQDFYTQVYADERLAPFFEGIPKQRVIEKQFAFLREKLTGERLYFGDRPRNAHHWMVISNELFDHREALMERSLRKHGLAEHFVQAMRALDEVFRKQIVKSAPVGKKVRGVELPFEGYGEVELVVGILCDGCQGEIAAGEVVRYHNRTGRTFCAECVPPESTRSRHAVANEQSAASREGH